MALIAKFTVIHEGETYVKGDILPDSISDFDKEFLIEGDFVEENPDIEAPKSKTATLAAKKKKSKKDEPSTEGESDSSVGEPSTEGESDSSVGEPSTEGEGSVV